MYSLIEWLIEYFRDWVIDESIDYLIDSQSTSYLHFADFGRWSPQVLEMELLVLETLMPG